MPPLKPSRRWYQFGLSTLLVAVTLISLPLGYVAWEREQCRRGKEALEMLRNAESNLGTWSESSPSGRPAWLKTVIGDDDFRAVDEVTLRGNTISDSDLRLLAALPNLHDIGIIDANVTDDGVAYLRNLQFVEVLRIWGNPQVTAKDWGFLGDWRHLRSLSFHDNHSDPGVPDFPALTSLKDLHVTDIPITAATLDTISRQTTVEYLALNNTGVTDADLRHLSRLKNLRSLFLFGTNVRGSGLTHLAEPAKLENLCLTGCPVSDDGLAPLAAMTRLDWLDLNDTQVTDQGLGRLAKLKSLRKLFLEGTKVSDEGILQLRQLANLTDLTLYRTNVTAAGAAELRKAMPKATIQHWDR